MLQNRNCKENYGYEIESLIQSPSFMLIFNSQKLSFYIVAIFSISKWICSSCVLKIFFTCLEEFLISRLLILSDQIWIELIIAQSKYIVYTLCKTKKSPDGVRAFCYRNSFLEQHRVQEINLPSKIVILNSPM